MQAWELKQAVGIIEVAYVVRINAASPTQVLLADYSG